MPQVHLELLDVLVERGREVRPSGKLPTGACGNRDAREGPGRSKGSNSHDPKTGDVQVLSF